MDALQFNTLLRSGIRSETVSMEELDEEIRKAPYAANLYVLKAQLAHHLQLENFDLILQKAAARTLSRVVLKQKIEGPLVFDPGWQMTEIPKDDSVTRLETPPILENSGSDAPVEIEEHQMSVQNESPTFITTDPPVETLINEPVDLEVPTESPTKRKAKPKNNFIFGFVPAEPRKTETALPEQGPYQLPSQPKTKKKKTSKPEDVLIDRFLEKQPGFIPPKIDFGNPEQEDDLAKRSGFLSEEIITENMAMIYLKQKNYEKAVSTFQKLQLKFPEKSDYFAALIKNLENQK